MCRLGAERSCHLGAQIPISENSYDWLVMQMQDPDEYIRDAAFDYLRKTDDRFKFALTSSPGRKQAGAT